MDPLTIIATALVAGAAAGGKEAASAAVRDTYSTVRDRIRHLADSDHAEVVLDANDTDPGANIADVADILAQHGVIEDAAAGEAAKALLAALPSEQVRGARAWVDLRGAKGVQIGDHNTQHNSFG